VVIVQQSMTARSAAVIGNQQRPAGVVDAWASTMPALSRTISLPLTLRHVACGQAPQERAHRLGIEALPRPA